MTTPESSPRRPRPSARPKVPDGTSATLPSPEAVAATGETSAPPAGVKASDTVDAGPVDLARTAFHTLARTVTRTLTLAVAGARGVKLPGPAEIASRLRGVRLPTRSDLNGWVTARAETSRQIAASPWMLLSLAFAGLGMAALVAGLASSTLRLDSYGLISSLPPVYIIGLTAIVAAGAVAIVDRRQGPALLLALAFVFALAVWITPLILEGTARFRTSYTNLGYVDPILRGVGLVPGHFLYHNWPLFPLVMAWFIEITRFSALTVLEWFPIVMIVAFTGAVVTLTRILGRRLDRVASLTLAGATAAWTYVIFNWTGQEYFSPQALAYLIFLVLLCVLAWIAMERDGELSTRLTAAVLVLFALIVATHVLTAIVTLGVLAVLLLTRHLRRWTILITCGLIFIVWQVTVAAPFFVFYGEHLLTSILGAGDFFGSNLESRIRGDAGHTFITELRVLTTIVPFALAGVVVLLFALRSPEWRARLRHWRVPDLPRSVSFPVAVVLGTFLVAPVSLYGGEMLIRVLFFTLPPLSALIALGMHERWFKAVVLATFVVMAPVHLLTHYGNEMLDYVSPGEIAGFDYISSLAPANVYGAFPAASTFNTIRLDARNAYLFRNLQPASLADYSDPLLHHDWVHPNWPLYVAVSRGDAAAVVLFQDRPGFIEQARALLDSDPNYEKVFENQDIAVYLWKASATGQVDPAEELTGTYAASRGSPPLPLALLCLLGVLVAVGRELAVTSSGRPRLQAAAVRWQWQVVGFSLLVVAVSGYRVAELIGYIQ